MAKKRRTDMSVDGDTGEWQFLIYLETKNEKVAYRRAEEIVKRYNVTFKKPLRPRKRAHR